LKYFYYITLMIVLAVISLFTGEIVTLIMLGFILISLQNIHNVLKKILDNQKNE